MLLITGISASASLPEAFVVAVMARLQILYGLSRLCDIDAYSRYMILIVQLH